MPDTSFFIPAKAGIHPDAGGTCPAWHDVLRALIRGLCLADPWVPAFAGTATERDRWARIFAEWDEP
jgi:hypothetical protein